MDQRRSVSRFCSPGYPTADVFGVATVRWYTIVLSRNELISISMKLSKSSFSCEMMIEEVHGLGPDVVGTASRTVHRLDLGVVAELGKIVHNQ